MRLTSRPLLALAGLAVLAGCAEPTFNPDDPNQRTRQGAIAGCAGIWDHTEDDFLRFLATPYAWVHAEISG